MRLSWTAPVVLCILLQRAPSQPTPAPANSQVIGEVTSLDGQARRLVVKDDKGGTIAVVLGERNSVLRVPPGETDIKKATRITLADVSSGDRVLAVGAKSPDGAELQARTLVVMTRADIAQKQQQEQQDWQKRGTSGTIAGVDSAAGTFTLKAGQRTLTVQPGSQTEYRRYAPDSVKYSDSTPGTFAELKVGDQVRVLGNRSDDGIKAERVVSGSFRQMAGTILSIRADAGEIRITDLASKKPVTVTINSASVMKKLPPEMAAALSRRFRPAAQGAPPTPAGQARGAGAAPPGRGGQFGGNGDLGQVLDRLPALPLSDLKQGDAIMVSGSAGTDATRLTAITLLAGVEPLLTASPDAARDIMAGWNFGGGGEGGPE